MSDISDLQPIVSQGMMVTFPAAELAYRRERFNAGHTDRSPGRHHLRTAYRRVRGVARHDAGDLG